MVRVERLAKLERPFTIKVEEAFRGPPAENAPTTVEEAVEIYPVNVCKPVQVLLSSVAPGNLHTPSTAKQPSSKLIPFA